MFSSISGAAVESEGCPIPVGDSVCGETNSLEIMKEFNQLYEERMKDVDMAGGDCLKEKIKLQEEWIRNLIQQNEMLVKAVQELEYEATERVHQLEQKLQKSAQCLCEGEKILNRKDETIQDLTQKLNYYNSFGDVATMAQELQLRKVECDSLKQDMIDMREALTEEVAAKHDEIMALRREVQALEERCVQADKQTAFKEDIIKELRKEIKQLKTPPPENDAEKPYIIVNHSSKKQPGKNTIFYIKKDGTVRKEESVESGRSLCHVDECVKCQKKLTTGNQVKQIYGAKSETELINVKRALRPVKERSRLTNRYKTFVDCPETHTQLLRDDINYKIPVKMHVNYLERIHH